MGTSHLSLPWSFIPYGPQSPFNAKTIPTIGLIYVSSYLKPSLRNATFIMLSLIMESKCIANIRIFLIVEIDGVKCYFQYTCIYKLLEFR
jgi:hypothetical protein